MIPIENNVLSDYASHTYAFRLYQAPNEEFQSVIKNLGSRGTATSLADRFSKIAIISETAVTPIQINNVQIQTQRTSQGIMTSNITFDMTEPRDSTLIEQMTLARMDMGWLSPTQHFGLVFEIRFIGRKDNNEVDDYVATITYPILIKNVDISLDQSGTTYHFTSAPAAQGAVSDTFHTQRLNTTMTVNTGNSVGDFFNNYASMLNEKEEGFVDNETISIPRFIHEFEIDEFYSNKEVGNPRSGTQTSQNQSIHEYNSETNQVTFPNESLISSTIDTIIYSIDEARDDLLDGENDLVYIHEVVPVAVPTEYDSMADHYQYTITWHVVRRPTVPNIDDDESLSRLKTRATLLSNCFKLYDFYFTGTNTEVRSIEWRENNLYNSKTLAYRSLINRNNNNRTTTGMHNHDTMDMDVQQASFENAPEDTWGIDAKPNDRGENVYYTTDQDISTVDYRQPNPVDIINTSDSDYSSTDIDSNKRLIEYLNQLSYIRNMGGEHAGAYVSANIRISGDPYWLLPPNPLQIGMSGVTTASNTSLPLVIIRFYHPSNDYYEGDAFLSARENSAFTGVYIVAGTVTSTFNNGRFEQTLSVRRSGLKPSEVIELLAEGGIN